MIIVVGGIWSYGLVYEAGVITAVQRPMFITNTQLLQNPGGDLGKGKRVENRHFVNTYSTILTSLSKQMWYIVKSAPWVNKWIQNVIARVCKASQAVVTAK
jgi:hypothetical protein